MAKAAKKKKPAARKVAAKAAPAPAPEFEIVDCVQGTDEWLQARLGLVTASHFNDVLACGREDGTSASSLTRASYMRRLAGEIITGIPAETYQSAAMRRGNEMEVEAAEEYARLSFGKVTKVGFVRRKLPSGTYVGCSPDLLVDDDGAAEIKTLKPELLIDLTLRGTAPAEHRAQCQGTLWVTGRQWIDLKIFYRGMPGLRFRMTRNEPYIEEIRKAVETFEYQLRQLVKQIRSMGGI